MACFGCIIVFEVEIVFVFSSIFAPYRSDQQYVAPRVWTGYPLDFL